MIRASGVVACLLCSLFLCCASTPSAKQIRFTSAHFQLVGELILPAGEGPFPVVLFVHGDGPARREAYAHEKERMRSAGYATFVWDKPGYGESTGKFEEKQLLHQRARIVLDAIAIMKKEPAIDPRRIGLWGISQGGYVMAIALSECQDISFMVAVSCPGESSARQASYLLRSVAECGGAPKETADRLEKTVYALNCAQTYEEYLAQSHEMGAYDRYIEDFVGRHSGPKPREKWHAVGPEYLFDPMTSVEKVSIPILAFFGERDKQADPLQGMEAYQKAIRLGGNKRSRVVMVPGVDHVMVFSPTGCIREWQTRTRDQWANHSPLYLDTMRDWLIELKGS